MNIPDSAKQAAYDSIDNYASEVQGKTNREIMNSKFKKPTIDAGLNLNDPRTRQFVNSWDNVMASWRHQYGSIAGYAQFETYWQSTNLSFQQAFGSSEYQSLRDRFGNASAYDLYNQNNTQLANG